MRTLRRATVLAAVGFTIGALLAATPAAAAPVPVDAVDSAGDAVPGQVVAKDGQGRTLVYVEGEREDQLRAAVAAAGGEVARAADGRVKAAVPGDRLRDVAEQPGVREVRLPDRAVPMSITSAGVAAAKADLWHQAGKKGAGVKVGVVDVGFGLFQDAVDNGELPAGTTVNNSNCLDGTAFSSHGTAVAEVVHDMAPDATLYLACVEDSVSFAAAEEWLRQQGVQVVTAAIGFVSPTGGRGDGTGPAGSPADVVRRSREAGLLWSVAAGNQARLHYGGPAVSKDGDKWVEFAGLSAENNGFTVDAHSTATVGLRWDAWPTTTGDLDLYVMSQPHPPTGPTDPDIAARSTRAQKDTPGGLSPTEEVTFTNGGSPAVARQFYVYVENHTTPQTTPFDLFVSGPSGQLQFFTEAGSVTEPATSSSVLAVGASAVNTGAVHQASGRGPTIDGRIKPDLIGYSNVDTFTTTGLGGTSAAAAHVAGAAALLKSNNPALDAAQIQASLRATANPKHTDNTWGYGGLSLGVPTSTPGFTGAGFTVNPVQSRVHTGSLGPNGVYTLPFATVPGDTTAVAITFSARSDVDTVVDVMPEVGSAPATSLRVKGGQLFTSLTAFVPLGADRSIRLRNRSGTAVIVVEYLGHFSPSESTDLYTPRVTPYRVVDSRGYNGSSRNYPLAGGGEQWIGIRNAANVPANATSVVVNLTAFEATAEQYLGFFPTGVNSATTTLALAPGDTRSNLSVVPIGTDGRIHLKNYTASGQTGFAVDIVGWFAPGSGSKFVTLPEAARVADTTTGNGLPVGRIGGGRSAAVQVKGIAGISASSVAAAMTVTSTEDLFGTELTVTPQEKAWQSMTSMASRKREPLAGMVLAPLGASGKVDIRNERGNADVSVDVSGYFVGGTYTPGTDNCVHADDPAGFTSVFDGRAEYNLGGWRKAGAKQLKVEGCELVTDTGTDVTWYGARTFGNDYTLKVDWKAQSAESDSGVFVLFPNPGDDPAAPGTNGVEVNIAAASSTGTQTGSITGLQGPSALAAKPVGEWNTYEISVRWNMVTVLLNGTKVNEIKLPAGRYAKHSYIGLQNNGTFDPVRFRNVRIKKDSPITSGAFVNSGKCLNLRGETPYQPVVELLTCNGGFGQVATTPGEGSIQLGGRCVTPEGGGTGNGTLVVVQDCSGSEADAWITRPDGRIVNINSGRCLTSDSGVDGARLRISDCSPTASSQVWQIPTARGRSGVVSGPGGKCLDVAGHNPLDNKAILWPCNGWVAQNWVVIGDGTVRGEGKCLDVAGSGTADGTPVNLWTCNNNPAQQWTERADGTFQNPQSGKCLTSASTDDAALLSIQPCTASPTQRWRLTAEHLMRGWVPGFVGKCAELGNNDVNSLVVQLGTCRGVSTQVFWNVGDNALRSGGGRCLDISSTNNRTPVTTAVCAPGWTSQQWVTRYTGAIVNPLSNRCLDVRDGMTADGTLLQINDCHGGLTQVWGVPAKTA
ncbi:ricin-type beta-trefoil lectin domain protein [Saccharothrix obliqua]|uniref:ricin-type beta-trefoil lectin domain protein n=1 Tax=Saccharothrix obliqua TaxID=2861747 RepID=UPI001C5FC1F0|nr:ricin-type beta-trefoil lectin domain protein [Saccharothrix obliqua]MBW4720716.1 ricin-type beta-trefoil lectin domain protein [Saccharothrix obliqua]